jgi:hypothetical protein
VLSAKTGIATANQTDNNNVTILNRFLSVNIVRPLIHIITKNADTDN